MNVHKVFELRTFCLVGLAFFAESLCAAALLPGEWLITTKVTVSGAKAQPQPITFRHCLKPSDVESPAEAISRANEELKKQQCTLTDKVESEDAVQYRMSCSGTVKLQADAQFTFTATSYQGTIDMKVAPGGVENMSMQNEVSAKRVGDCKK